MQNTKTPKLMPTRLDNVSLEPITPESPTEALILQQARAFYRDMKATAQNAPFGKALQNTEVIAVTNGREMMRNAFQSVIQEQVQEYEKKRSKNVSNMRNEKKTSRIQK